MIANSGHDERGKYYGGVAGDQTGAEWQIRTWYNRPWNCVLRHPDSKVRAKIAELAKKSANNNNIGYNQYRRTTFWQQLAKVGYDPSKIETRCDSDCSAGVSAIVKAVGYLLGIQNLKDVAPTNWTGSMRLNFRAAGFEVLTASKYLTSDAYLLPGDILLNEKHHTCINLDTGSKVAPQKTDKGETSQKLTLKAYEGKYPSVLPNLKKGSKGEQVKRLQAYLNWFGNYGLVVDGDFGTKTKNAVMDFQKRTGLTVDGIFGSNSLKMAKAMKK